MLTEDTQSFSMRTCSRHPHVRSEPCGAQSAAATAVLRGHLCDRQAGRGPCWTCWKLECCRKKPGDTPWCHRLSGQNSSPISSTGLRPRAKNCTIFLRYRLDSFLDTLCLFYVESTSFFVGFEMFLWHFFMGLFSVARKVHVRGVSQI